jgi:hypothetical protein
MPLMLVLVVVNFEQIFLICISSLLTCLVFVLSFNLFIDLFTIFSRV